MFVLKGGGGAHKNFGCFLLYKKIFFFEILLE